MQSHGKNNVSPRLGFAYALDRKGNTVVRGSFGLFYIQEDLLDVSQAFASNGVTRPFLVVVGPKFGNSNPLVTYPNSLTSFPTGVGGTPSIVVFSPNFRSPYVEQANAAVEHQFGSQTALSVCLNPISGRIEVPNGPETRRAGTLAQSSGCGLLLAGIGICRRICWVTNFKGVLRSNSMSFKY
jgi:hypothetical protein